MRIQIAVILLYNVFTIQMATCQDTFSIVAVDTLTGEIGCAAASCVDLYAGGASSDDFLGKIIPGVGVIMTQADYNPTNQDNATKRMIAGDTPEQIIQWLIDNDSQNSPNDKQYGIAAIIGGAAQTAAHTGGSTPNYHHQIVGSNYAIQGNTLLGAQVLSRMESGFLNEPGGLKCKLMAAMQGAKMVGADRRCKSQGVSSLFAFIKVAVVSDPVGSPSFLISARTHKNDRIEPIDVLQSEFDNANTEKGCSPTGS
jgi:uncharacterized Ntn-hydrolase superfamily protein